MSGQDISCLTPFCDNRFIDGRGSRGLCASCYHIAYMAIQFHLTTWEALEEQGKVLKGKPRSGGLYDQQIRHFIGELPNQKGGAE